MGVAAAVLVLRWGSYVAVLLGRDKAHLARGTRASNRRGMTLLELVIASTMLAVVLASVGVVMRTGRLAWEAHSNDYTRVEAAHAVIRHIVRSVRQAARVDSVTPSVDDSGRLALKLTDGSVVVADEAYIHESIVAPQEKIVAGFENQLMPTYSFTDEQIDDIIAYIKTLR